eukprot:TRINITY_DN5496_c0_g1_i2.p1 TRINITY_DN5496_c0_g1~~TRINITY_DN5496_c0_g1_i2.p1  ORF type:complete len:342 (-),score=55.07 TRINITY_DN5496_c0_g1_i2:179-1204(-)
MTRIKWADLQSPMSSLPRSSTQETVTLPDPPCSTSGYPVRSILKRPSKFVPSPPSSGGQSLSGGVKRRALRPFLVQVPDPDTAFDQIAKTGAVEGDKLSSTTLIAESHSDASLSKPRRPASQTSTGNERLLPSYLDTNPRSGDSELPNAPSALYQPTTPTSIKGDAASQIQTLWYGHVDNEPTPRKDGVATSKAAGDPLVLQDGGLSNPLGPAQEFGGAGGKTRLSSPYTPNSGFGMRPITIMNHSSIFGPRKPHSDRRELQPRPPQRAGITYATPASNASPSIFAKLRHGTPPDAPTSTLASIKAFPLFSSSSNSNHMLLPSLNSQRSQGFFNGIVPAPR